MTEDSPCTTQRIVAANIRRIRRSLRFTQADLASRAGISTGYLCDIERCRRWPGAGKLETLAEVLQLEPFQLFLPTEDSPYFDRHRTLMAFHDRLKAAIAKSADSVLEDMVNPGRDPMPDVTIGARRT